MSLQLAILLGALVASGIVGAGLLSRDDRAGTGFLLGAVLGPIGVGVILARRRHARGHSVHRGARGGALSAVLHRASFPPRPGAPGRCRRFPHDEGDRLHTHGTDLGRWFYNAMTSTDRPANLGYWMGFQIAEAYFDRARDERQAVSDLLQVSDPADILARSGYGEGGAR